jgi:diadenylate cyclase
MPRFEPLQQLLVRLRGYAPWEVAIELLIIGTIVWMVWRFVKGTRAAGALKGILVLVLVTIALRLVTPVESFSRVAFLYDNILGFAALALVIVFQPEIRRALIRLGETTFFRESAGEMARVVEAIVEACSFLSKNKFGAILAVERHVGLRETIETGRILNADVSAELLQSIFWPNNPLHDMGVVIKRAKIVAAGVQFPLADAIETTDPTLGTRHRAAAGLSRVTDALVVVVSEETGMISIADHGRLLRGLTPSELRAELTRRLPPQGEAQPGAGRAGGGVASQPAPAERESAA